MPTKIDWCRNPDGTKGETINPLGWGCYGPGGTAEQPNRCPFCYAHRLAKRHLRDCPKCREFVPHEHPAELEKVRNWKRSRRIFVESMGDLFGVGVDEDWLHEIFSQLQYSYQHTKIILTKEATRMRQRVVEWERKYEMFEQICDDERFWFGVSVTCPDDEKRIEELFKMPAAVRWVSIEPMLGPVSLYRFLGFYEGDAGTLDWVVVGAQTGTGAVLPDLAWVETIRAQCEAAGVPLFEKASLAKVVGRPLIQKFPKEQP